MAFTRTSVREPCEDDDYGRGGILHYMNTARCRLNSTLLSPSNYDAGNVPETPPPASLEPGTPRPAIPA